MGTPREILILKVRFQWINEWQIESMKKQCNSNIHYNFLINAL